MGLDAGSLAIQELNNLMKDFIARHAPKCTAKQTSKHPPKHNQENQELSQRNCKRTLLVNLDNTENRSDILEDSDSDNFDSNSNYGYTDESDDNNEDRPIFNSKSYYSGQKSCTTQNTIKGVTRNKKEKCKATKNYWTKTNRMSTMS
ncbi:hypothetical protein C2G38_2037099 [Gigaspora rosea]|uniref:Uncharacterized protein n=1 Tax=Gigaspora rosea TaxID=44941 RepID=A0A397VE08_9GLOM|nr:hypothetical protein C2G38_2037099 [Gigaspora rosea]